MAGEFHVAIGKHGSVENLVAEFTEVISKQVIRLYVEVVPQVFQVVMHQVAVNGGAVFCTSRLAQVVIGGGVANYDVVGTQDDAVAIDAVLCAEHSHAQACLVHQYVAFKVDLLERTEYAYPSACPSLQVVKDAFGKLVHEVQIDALGVYTEVNAAFLSPSRGDGSLHKGVVSRFGFLDVCVQINAVAVVAPVAVYVHAAHASFVEGEVVHRQIGVCHGLGHHLLGIDVAGGVACELHGVEVDHLENVFQVYLV